MAICACGHDESDHKLRHNCDEVIIYPSEEYPCDCERYAASMADDCIHCGHPKNRHVVMVRCVPSSGELCSCSKRIGPPS